MYLKEATISKFIILILIGILISISGCSSGYVQSTDQLQDTQSYSSRYLVPNQIPAPQTIKSIQLYRKTNETGPPVLHLGSTDKLVLAFDELSDISGQFTLKFTHHDQNWEDSNIPSSWYMENFEQMTMGGGSRNFSSAPDYYHYTAEFPNRQIQFKISGNYMLHVIDYNSGKTLFTLPFYITENEGELTSWVQTDYNAGSRAEAIDRPFSSYEYPDFVEYPQFDLSFSFVQNRFWGDTRFSENYDFTEANTTQFHLSRSKAFSANFDLIGLNINRFSMNGRKIIDWQPGATPPRLILREDVLNFSSDPDFSIGRSYFDPLDSPDSRYANVEFRFQDSGEFTAEQGVYLTGDFNQWILSGSNKLTYDEQSGYWTTTELIKQGTYTYSYTIRSSGGKVDDLQLSDTLTRQEQEYHSFVYYRDPDLRYQRLLQIQQFRNSEY